MAHEPGMKAEILRQHEGARLELAQLRSPAAESAVQRPEPLDGLSAGAALRGAALHTLLQQACSITGHIGFFEKCLAPLAPDAQLALNAIPSDAMLALRGFLPEAVLALRSAGDTGAAEALTLVVQHIHQSIPWPEAEAAVSGHGAASGTKSAECDPNEVIVGLRAARFLQSLDRSLKHARASGDAPLCKQLVVSYERLPFSRWNISLPEAAATTLLAASTLSWAFSQAAGPGLMFGAAVTGVCSAVWLLARAVTTHPGAAGPLKSFFFRPDPRSTESPALRGVIEEIEKRGCEPIFSWRHRNLTIRARLKDQ